MFLNQGDEVTFDFEVIDKYHEHVETIRLEGTELILHHLELGKRRTIAGIEKAIYGMKAGGYREVVIAPHLAYRDKGVSGKIPENALLKVRIWVRDVDGDT